MQYLINPFRYVAGTKALLWGWVIILITAIIAWQSSTHFDGVIDAHFANTKSPAWVYFAESAIDWLIMTLFFYTAGRIVSRSEIRLIDVAGTMALTRTPMFFVALIGFIPLPAVDVNHLPEISANLIVVGLATMVFAIWMIAWMYQAYATSCNLKGAKAIFSFILALILAEAVSLSIVRNL